MIEYLLRRSRRVDRVEQILVSVVRPQRLCRSLILFQSYQDGVRLVINAVKQFAAATVAPLGSVTVPRIRPPVLCASVLVENKSNVVRARKDTYRMLFHNKVWKDRFDFIELTPETPNPSICTVFRG